MGKPLIETNSHLCDAGKRERSMARNIETSSAVEGIRVVRDPETGRFRHTAEKPGEAGRDGG